MLIAGCSSPDKPAITIGALLSISGDCSSGSDEIVEAINLAVSEINDAGGVNNATLVVKTQDDQSDPEKAKDGARTLVTRDKAVAIVGNICSSLTLPASEVSAELGVPQISPISTSPLITTAADDGYLFRTAPSDLLQGELLAKRAFAAGARSVAIAYDPDAYGEGLRDRFSAVFMAQGGMVGVVGELPSDPDASDYGSTLDAIVSDILAGSAPDAIAVFSQPIEAADLITRVVVNPSLSAKLWFFSDAVKQVGLTEQLKGGSEYIKLLNRNVGSTLSGGGTQAYEDFAARFNKRYGRDPDATTGSPQAYDATYLIALAIAAGGATDGPTLRDALTDVSKGGTAVSPATPADALKRAKAKEDIDYEGVTGACDFDAAGDVSGATYDIWQVVNKANAPDFETTEVGVTP